METPRMIINRRYSILDKLGGGAQGTVYLAFDLLAPDKKLALKTLASGSESALLRFEFEQLSRLQHPHLVRVYDLDTVRYLEGETSEGEVRLGTGFFTQDLIEGEPAHKYARRLPIDERIGKVSCIIVAVARALSLLHNWGLLHRDIKPSNILVSEDANDIRLIDLGLALRTGSRASLKAGTLGFMAPEALAGYPDERSDIYALGVTLAQLLSNRPPRMGHPISDSKPPYVHDDLWQLVLRLVDRNPDRRLQTAREVALALGRIVGVEVLGKQGDSEFIDASSDMESRSTRISRARAPYLIGRDDETTRLRDWLEDIIVRENKKIGTAILAGVSGVGKSRLFDTATKEIQLKAAGGGGPPITSLTGSLRSLVRSIACREKERWPLAAAWSGADRPGFLQPGEAGERAPLGGELARESLARENLSREIAQVIGSLEKGTVLFVEDGDDPLVQRVLPWFDEVQDPESIAVILEMRHLEAARALAEDWQAELFELMPLSLGKESELVTEILSRDPGRGFTARLHRLTGGLPLLTEAVMASFVSCPQDMELNRGSLDGIDFSLEPAKVALDGLLLGLDAVAVALVRASAVLEMASDIKHLLRVADMDGGVATLGALNQLESRRLFILDEDGLVRLPGFVSRALYQYMPEDIRNSMHKAAFELKRENQNEDVVELARHAVLGGLEKEAEPLLKEAFAGLKAVGDLDGAAQQLSLLLTLENIEQRVLYETELARLYRHTGRYEEAIELALSIEEKGGGDTEAAVLERAAALRLSGKTDRAYSLLMELLGSRDQDVAREARALAARIDLDRGDVETAQECIGAFDTEPDFRLVRSGTYATAGLIALALRDKVRATEIFEAGKKAAREMGDLKSRAKFIALLGMTLHLSDELDTARKHYQQAFQLAKKAGDRHGAATYAVNLAAAETELGLVKDALASYRDGLRRLRNVGRIEELVHAGANYALLMLRVGDLRGADTVSKEIVDDAAEIAESPARVHALRVRGDVLHSLGKPDEATEILLEAETLATKLGITTELGPIRQLLAEVHLPSDWRQALVWLEKAEASGADTQALTRLEQHRLSLEVARARGENSETALTALLDCLDITNVHPQPNHIKALVTGARAAFDDGQQENARLLAKHAIDLLTELQAQTPPLHRQSDSPILTEMQSICQRSAAGPKQDRTDARKSDDNVHRTDARESDDSGQNTARDWERLVRINTRLNSETRVGHLLELIMDTAIDLMDAERGFLLLIDDGGEFTVRCARNISRESLVPGESNYSRSVAFRATDNGEPILTTDAQEDERFQSMGSVLRLSLRYIAAVPLQIRGKTIGAVYVDSRKGGRFDEERLDLLRALSDQAAIALSNARLMAENRQRQQQVEQLLSQVKAELKSREGELEKIKDQLALHTGETGVHSRYPGIIARSAAMEEVFHLLDRIVDSDLPVVIQGESGTGKELIARALHFHGARKNKAFVAENCAAIPETLLESVLFGHARGAFTGAVKDNKGLFVEADGGTLFLDEVSAMPLAMQVKLLRVLQESIVRPVGGVKTTKVDVRIVVASNTDLSTLVKQGNFREDLYYRLNVVTVALPPLRKRQGDVILLAEHFARKYSKGEMPRLSKEVLGALEEYPWPGNVRQLENEMMRAVLLCDGNITLDHLSEEITVGVSQMSDSDMDLDMTRQVDELKKRLVKRALNKTRGNQTAAAQLLGISRFGLQKMLARLDIRTPKKQSVSY